MPPSVHQTESATISDLFTSWRPPSCQDPEPHWLYVLSDGSTDEVLYAGQTHSASKRLQEHATGSHNALVRSRMDALTMHAWPVDPDHADIEERRLIAFASFHGRCGNRHRGGVSEFESLVGGTLGKPQFAGYLAPGLHQVELLWCGRSSNQRYWGCIYAHAAGFSYTKIEISPQHSNPAIHARMRQENRQRLVSNALVIGLDAADVAGGKQLHGLKAVVRAWETPFCGKGGRPNVQQDVVQLAPRAEPLQQLTRSQIEQRDREVLRQRWTKLNDAHQI